MVSGSSVEESDRDSDAGGAPVRTNPQPHIQQQADGSNVRDQTISIKLEGEERPFPSAPEVLEAVLKYLQKVGLTIDGMVWTGACFHEVRGQNFRQVDRIVDTLHGKQIRTWTISARKAGERLPMYVVLNALFRITNADIYIQR